MIDEGSISPKEVYQIIHTDPAFRALNETNKLYFAKHASLKKYKKSSKIWKKRSKANACFYLRNGYAEITQFNKQGEENIQGFCGPGEIIGLPYLLNRSHYEDDANTVSKNSQVLMLHLSAAKVEIIGQDKINFLEWQSAQLIKTEQFLRKKIHILSAGDLNQRIVELFEQLIEKFSLQTEDSAEVLFIPFSITKTQIAKIVGARIETVIRILRMWERAGHLELSANGVSLKKWKKLKQQRN